MADDDDLEIYEEVEEETPPASQSARQQQQPPAKAWQTTVRESLTPYLPPPVVQAIQRTDPQLEPYLGPEGTVTLFTSLFVGFFVWKILQTFTKTGRAIDEDDDAVISTSKAGAADDLSYGATVLLVGPSNSGKTCLFYRLCYGTAYSKMPTLLSLKANVGYSTSDENINPSSIRYMDWPGSASLSDTALQTVLTSNNKKKQPTRTVLVLDATQPVAAAADVLYQLLAANDKQPIFVACHKTDYPKAKNWRRIKIQMRTELERLLKLSASKEELEATTTTTWWPAGKTLDMDALPLHFCSTSSEGRFSPELLSFCQTGKVPEATK